MDSMSRKAGGIFPSAKGLAVGMARAGDQVAVDAPEDEFSRRDLPEWEGVRVETHPLVGPSAFGYSPGLLRGLLARHADVIHVHGLWKYASVAAMRASSRLATPRIVHVHGMLEAWALRRSPVRKALARVVYESRSLRDAACIRALSESEWRSVRRAGCAGPVAIIPNGVDPAGPSPSNERIRGVADGSRILLYLGRIHENKGLDLLVGAWARVARNPVADGWSLAIAGWDQDGHERELRRLARELAVPERRLRFVGPQFGTDKAAWLAHCDALVLPSRGEALPTVVLEAWAHSKAVVMTDQCNLRQEAAAGAAIESADTQDALCDALAVLVRMSDAERRAMGERGRKLVERSFAWPRIVDEMRAVHGWLVGGGSPPASVRLD